MEYRRKSVPTRTFAMAFAALVACALTLGGSPLMASAEEEMMATEDAPLLVSPLTTEDDAQLAEADDTAQTTQDPVADPVADLAPAPAQAPAEDAASAEDALAQPDDATAPNPADVTPADATTATSAEDEDMELVTQSSGQASKGYFAAVNAFLSDGRWSDGVWWGWKTPNIANCTSWQCYAYACDFTKYMYGVDDYENGTFFYDASQVRTGDVIRANGHTFVVLERSGNNLWTAEGNFEERVRVEECGYRISGNGFMRVYHGNDIVWVPFSEGYHFDTGGATTRTATATTRTATATASAPKMQSDSQPRSATSIATAKARLSTTAVTYNGKARKPTVTSLVVNGRTLVKDTDFTVAYSNNTNAGTASVVITGKGSYAGTTTATFEIRRKSIAGLAANKISSLTYTGKARTPVPVVYDGSKKLKKGTDFTVAYRSNKAAGTATAIVTGQGNYKGTLKVAFTIAPAANTVKARARMSRVALLYSTAYARKVSNIVVSGVQGKVRYAKVSGHKSLSVDPTTGSVRVARGTKPGTYRVTVKVRAAGNANYKAGSRNVSFDVKVIR